MCGIYLRICLGIKCEIEHSTIDRLNNSANSYRGQDSKSEILESGLFLGFHRLAIQDLATGEQPYVFSQSISAINGELYNKLEVLNRIGLNQEHDNLSDMQILARAIDLFGLEALRMARGQFAGFLLSRSDRKAYLFRDRFGEKPLFYSLGNDHLLVSSTANLVHSKGWANPEPADLLVGYLVREELGYMAEVPPGTLIEIQLDSLSQVSHTFFSEREVVSQCQVKNLSNQRHFASLFEDAVLESLISDVPVSLLFSGGIDSTAIAVALKKLGVNSVTAFTLSFLDEAFDESQYAKHIASKIDLAHKQVSLNYEEVAFMIPRILQFMDIPIFDTSAISLFALSQQVSKEFKVGISGDGGDELFRGYSLHTNYRAIATLSVVRELQPILTPILHLLSALLPSRGYNNSRFKLERVNATLIGLNHGVGIKLALSPLAGTPLLQKLLDSANKEFISDERGQPMMDSVDQLYRENIFPKVYLVKSDRMGMANGLEIRTPMLHPNLIGFSRENYPRKSNRHGKSELYDYCISEIPQALVRRTKHGFSFPVSRLLKYLAEPEWNIPFLKAELEIVSRIWKRGKLGHVNSAIAAWSLLVTNHFFTRD